MSRPRGDLCVTWKIRLSASLAAAIEQLTMNPSTGAPRYGARRALVEQLFARYLREIGWHDSAIPLAERTPLSDRQIAAIGRDDVQPLFPIEPESIE